MSKHFAAWTIYKSPKDFPGVYVARKFLLDQGPEPVPTREHIVSISLVHLRGLVQVQNPYATCFHRAPLDEPQIVETWL